VIQNLDYSIVILTEEIETTVMQLPNEDISKRFTELKNIRANELKNRSEINEEEFQLKMQEAHLIIEQLIWLNNLSENIVKSTQLLMTIKKEA
jgi:hypothetical protein